MKLSKAERIDCLVELGERLEKKDDTYVKAREEAYQANAWFIPENTDRAVDAIRSRFLQRDLLTKWLESYQDTGSVKNVGLIMAGNIPLVGFHDFLTVFASGHHGLIKLSSKDEKLFNYILQVLEEIHPGVNSHVTIVERLKSYDAIIATGSNNTSRYFEYYFGKSPNIIRKNRNGAAVLTGLETTDELRDLCTDIFMYFGLGCRNVTKLYVPENYDFTSFLAITEENSQVAQHHKYRNNYDYNYALYLLNRDSFLASKNIILKEDPSYISRISCLHYEFYKGMDQIKEIVSRDTDWIQCICTRDGKLLGVANEVRFGQSQVPGLADYADGVDTMEFLRSLI